ncbi:hypothetical protein ACFL4V_00485 [Candidatus Latescibacterota bacterium]
MKLIKIFSFIVLLLIMILGFSVMSQARVMMTAMVDRFNFNVLPTATFTVDDWLSNPNLWTLIIQGDKKIIDLQVEVSISSTQYPLPDDPIATGTISVIGPTKSFQKELLAGVPFYLNNTMFQEGKGQVSGGDWSEDFVRRVMEIGYLPEDWYYLSFIIVKGTYSDGTPFTGDDLQVIQEEIEIRNPLPPELMTPEENSDDVVSIPRFTWQRPVVTDLTMVNRIGIQIFYTISLWKMFEDDGSILSEEEAITRIPIWIIENLPTEAVDFDPGSSREDLVSGRKYCWQVQAFDGLGRYISQTNEGKSDAWQFTVQFSPPGLNDPQTFFPLVVTWMPAQAGGSQVYYRIRIDEDPEFVNPYEETGIVMTSFTYPDDAPPLQRGTVYYFEVQTTDDSNIALGEPDQISFELPPVEVDLMSPDDGIVSPSLKPAFSWAGNSQYYVVTVYDETGDRTYSSSGIGDTRWIYDGAPLRQGVNYIWNVTPTNQYGDPIGDTSETWGFTLPSQNQASLVSPVNESIDTILPTFVWNEIPPTPSGKVVYNLTIMDSEENIVHQATATEAQYQYPPDAELLRYASRFTWSIVAGIEGTSATWESTSAWFTTPFIVMEGETVTMEDLSNALKVVMSDFPDYAEFENKILVSMSDESGPITPNQLIEIINTYKIIQVIVK